MITNAYCMYQEIPTDTKCVLLNGQSSTFVVAFESGFIAEPKEDHYAEITENLFYMKISIYKQLHNLLDQM